MSEPTVIPPGGGEIIGDAQDRRVEILSDHDSLHATWSRFGPYRDGADLHVHHRHSDLFYVLEGELTVRLGAAGEPVKAPRGTLARVPPGVVHGFRNGTGAELRYLNLHAPGVGFADYMRAIRDGRTLAYDQFPPPADGGRPAAEAVIGGDALRTERAVLLADIEEIAVAEMRTGPGGSPAHVHGRHDESFYVLEGELVLTAGDRELRAPAGAWAQVPAGVAHAVSSPGPEPARFLSMHTPSGGFGSFLRALEETGDEALAATQAAFDQEPAS
jgi:mannose-6-phosphate isomerase-like protein (cupin superfamily)